jgi:CRP/FNR family transcriptional regulator
MKASGIDTLSTATKDRLLAGALPVDIPAGGVIYRDDDEPRCGLVVHGLVRVYLSAPDGRTVTIRYARAGDLLGVPVIIGGPVPVSVQMVTDTSLLMLNGHVVRELGQTDAEMAWLLAREVTRRLYDTIDAVADNAFGSLRQRVARHLLDLAETREGHLIAAVAQHELAEAVGSARPAVGRVVSELRDLGLIATSPRGVAIIDPDGLHAQIWTREVSPW